MSFKVFIPTAGIGSRLEFFTKKFNKSLLPINHKAVISLIIEKCPKNCEFVIAVGHEGNLVKQYLNNAYPNKKFTYVNVKNFKNKGSSLGLTISYAKKYLQSPFVFIACDSIIKEKIISPKFNWVGYSLRKDENKIYRSIKIQNNKVFKIFEKKNKKEKNPIYIGVAGIKDYKGFWKNHKKSFYSKGEISSINKLMETKTFHPKKYSWYDIGTTENYKFTKSKLEKNSKFNILDKPNEKIFFVNNRVIKYSSSKDFINKRYIRSKILKNYVPNIDIKTKNFFSYEFVEGRVISSILNLSNFKKLLNFSLKFWKRKKLSKTKSFHTLLKFYKTKTLNRINNYFIKNELVDKAVTINSFKVPKVNDMIKKINWRWLCDGEMTQFHGDYHFENILFHKKNRSFTFLDWRQDFQGNVKYGDIYYDLGKLLHGMIVPHKSVVEKKFSFIMKNEDTFTINIKTSKNLEKCKKYFYYWLKKNNYDIDKVEIITSLIFLNIATLHHKNYDDFLFNLGKFNLYKVLKIKKLL